MGSQSQNGWNLQAIKPIRCFLCLSFEICSCDLWVCRTGEENCEQLALRGCKATCCELDLEAITYRAPVLSWETRRGWGSGPRRWCSDPRKPKGKQTRGVRSCPHSWTLCSSTSPSLSGMLAAMPSSRRRKKTPIFYIQMTGLSPDNITLVQRPKEVFTYQQDSIQSIRIQKINDDPFPLERKERPHFIVIQRKGIGSNC